MSVLNPNSDEEPQECPLCMEFLELDDINFYPCSCGYQICRFCWNKIRTEGSGNCPACRSPYSENPADFKPLTAEELAKIKAEKRQKDLAKKQRISENRKHLANVRVVQRNLVFVVGLSPRLADPEVLKKPEYFGRFGKIHKVVINTSTTYAGNQNQGPSASAYVTYYKSEDALRAIQAVNNVVADGRTLKASLGTTKYCSHFMKNMPCPKHDCMYLHELGDEAASFTKEEMQQGKHTEYEKNLHEELSMSSTVSSSSGSSTIVASSSVPSSSTPSSTSQVGPLQPGSEPTPASIAIATAVGTAATSTPAMSGGTPTTLTNGRAPSEHSDKFSSRTPSPHHQIANGGWPNLGLDNSKKSSRPFDHQPQQQQHQRNKSPLSTNSDQGDNSRPPLLINGSDLDHHRGQRAMATPDSIIASEMNSKNCDSSWGLVGNSNNTLTNSYKADLFEEDDLGFDPFHETQKALAEMLESESKQHQQHQQQQQQQQHRHLYQHQQSAPPFAHQPNRHNESPPLQNLRHESPVMNRAPGTGSNSLMGSNSGSLRTINDISNHLSSSGSSGRVKQPPPGFDPLSLLSTNGQQQQQNTQRNLLSPDMGLLNLEALTSQLNLNAGFGGGHHNDLGERGSRHDSGGPGNGFGGMMSGNHHLHNGMQQGLGLGLKGDNQSLMRSNSFLMENKQPQQNNLSKNWEDGLRALLPNVNVSFGALPHGPTNGSADASRMFSHQQSSMMNDHHERMQRQQQQSRSGWNSVKSPHNDWTTLDPAIVSGQVAPDNLSHNAALAAAAAGLRSESPPPWLKNNLDQITSDMGSSQQRFGGGGNNSANLLTGLAGLGLGQQQPQQQQAAVAAAIGHWGQPSPVMSNTPPPGFALNRGQMPGLPGNPTSQHQPHHPFSALAAAAAAAGVGNPAGDRDSNLVESELAARLVRS